MENIVEIKELFKTIDKEEILSDINLQIAEGEIYGFLGPNGAGKTTLMKCMLSLLTITSGSIEIFGKNLQECREEILSQVGSIIETPIFYEDRTAKEILEIHAQYMGKEYYRIRHNKCLKNGRIKKYDKKSKRIFVGNETKARFSSCFFNETQIINFR